MNHSRLKTLLFFALLYLPMAASPVSAKENWLNLRTKNFNFVSNAEEKETRELALKLEQFRFIFSKIYNTQGASTVPVTVIVFKSDSSFKPFKPLYGGKPANIAGYFQRSNDENIIALNIRGNEVRPLGLIYHEYTHFITSRTAREWPVWLTEGLAELFSTFEVKKNEVTLGIPLSEHVHFLRESKFLPLQSLFKVGHNSPEYNERDKQGVFYAQSWALLHYLMYGDKSARQPQLIQFVKMLESEADVDRAFAEAFKTDYAAMEKELRRYIGNRTYTVVTYTMESTQGERDVTARPLGEAEVQFHLGNLLLHTRRIEEGESFFRRAIALDASLPGPHEGLGFAAIRRQKYLEAKAHFKEAVARNSLNHLAYYYYAEALEREAAEDGNLSMKPEAIKTITELVRKAIALMPGFAPSYHLFGYVTLVSGENLDESVTALKNALALEPQNKNFAMLLAQAQFKLGDYASARKTLGPLLASDDPRIKDSAESLVKMIDTYTSPPPRAPAPNSAPGKAAPEQGRTEAPAGPTVKLAGTETMSGVLAALECDGRGIAIAFKAGDKLLRFAVSDPSKLVFYSRNPEKKINIGCGPINLPAFIYYGPAPSGQSRFAGNAVAVEFK
jgi:tetratricopeptide (TPR) repeat protein